MVLYCVFVLALCIFASIYLLSFCGGFISLTILAITGAQGVFELVNRRGPRDIFKGIYSVGIAVWGSVYIGLTDDYFGYSVVLAVVVACLVSWALSLSLNFLMEETLDGQG